MLNVVNSGLTPLYSLSAGFYNNVSCSSIILYRNSFSDCCSIIMCCRISSGLKSKIFAKLLKLSNKCSGTNSTIE